MFSCLLNNQYFDELQQNIETIKILIVSLKGCILQKVRKLNRLE